MHRQHGKRAAQRKVNSQSHNSQVVIQFFVFHFVSKWYSNSECSGHTLSNCGKGIALGISLLQFWEISLPKLAYSPQVYSFSLLKNWSMPLISCCFSVISIQLQDE